MTQTTVTPRAGALLLALALGVYGALGGLPLQPAHELHLELAHHAMRSLTSVWSTRWDLGHSFAGHPPLMHQLVSLLARVPGLGLERAYAVFVAATPVVLTWAMGRFAEKLQTPRAGDLAAWLTAANPLAYLFLFPYGQGPFLSGTAFALIAGSAWLEARSVKPAIAAACFAVAAVSSHAAALAPLAAVGPLALTSPGLTARMRGLIIVSAIASGALTALALMPFIEMMLAAPITPASKLLANGSLATGAVWAVIAVSTGVSAGGLGGRQGRWLGAVLIFFAAMSLAPLPTGVAADKWLWLAAAFSAVAWALAATERERQVPQALFMGAKAAVIAALMLTSSFVLGGSSNDGYGHRNTALREARLVLEQHGSELFRYFTLHIGAARFELARRVLSPSIDTGLPWVSATALKGTDFVTIDELPLSVPAGLAALRRVLEKAEALHIRWVLCGDSRATEALKLAGFDLRSAWKGDLTLWERSQVTPLEPPVMPSDSRSLLWAVVPLASTLVGAIALLARRKRALVS